VKFSEAMEALENGKKIYRADWFNHKQTPENYHWYLKNNKIHESPVYFYDDGYVHNIPGQEVLQNDWEIIE
jgi:hypothetical protein